MSVLFWGGVSASGSPPVIACRNRLPCWDGPKWWIVAKEPSIRVQAIRVRVIRVRIIRVRIIRVRADISLANLVYRRDKRLGRPRVGFNAPP